MLCGDPVVDTDQHVSSLAKCVRAADQVRPPRHARLRGHRCNRGPNGPFGAQLWGSKREPELPLEMDSRHAGGLAGDQVGGPEPADSGAWLPL
jgi:hypothetical protein